MILFPLGKRLKYFSMGHQLIRLKKPYFLRSIVLHSGSPFPTWVVGVPARKKKRRELLANATHEGPRSPTKEQKDKKPRPIHGRVSASFAFFRMKIMRFSVRSERSLTHIFFCYFFICKKLLWLCLDKIVSPETTKSTENGLPMRAGRVVSST